MKCISTVEKYTNLIIFCYGKVFTLNGSAKQFLAVEKFLH